MSDTPKIIIRTGATAQNVIDLLQEHLAGGLDPNTPIIGYDEAAVMKMATEPIMLDLDALMPRVIARITLAGKVWPLYHPQSLPAGLLTKLLAGQARLEEMTDDEKEAFLDDKIAQLSVTRVWNDNGTVTTTPGLTVAMVGPLPFDAKAKLYLALTGVEIRSASPSLDALEAQHTEPDANPIKGQSN